MKKAVLCKFTQEEYELLKELGEATLSPSVIQTIRILMLDGKSKYLENYKTLARSRKPRKARTPEEKAQDKLAQQEAENNLKREKTRSKWVGLCEALEGEVIEKDGRPYCRYPRFQQGVAGKVEQWDEDTPFSQMNDEMLTFQYLGLMGETGEEAKKIIKKLLK